MQLTQEQIYDMAPFARTLGVQFPKLGNDSVHARLANHTDVSTLGGALHGGAVMSLSDLAGAVCAGLHLDDGAGWTTVESTTYFLRPVRPDHYATAIATPVKLGRGLINVDIDVYDHPEPDYVAGDTDRHCARTSQVILIQPPARR